MDKFKISIDKRKFHETTAREMGNAIRSMIEARPHRAFTGLVDGRTYTVARGTTYGDRYENILRVERVTPTRKQADVVFLKETEVAMKIYAGSYHGECFIDLDEEILALRGVAHRDVVEEAVRRGLAVPPEVRREHPDLFVAVPERFANPAEWGAATAAERVKTTLANNYSWDPIDAAKVDTWIEAAHRGLVHLLNYSIRQIAENPALRGDYDRAQAAFHDLVDFYRWLRPHVDVGGALYIPSKAKEQQQQQQQ